MNRWHWPLAGRPLPSRAWRFRRPHRRSRKDDDWSGNDENNIHEFDPDGSAVASYMSCRRGRVPGKTNKEVDMSTLIRSALIALVLASGASAAMARPVHDNQFVDKSDPYGGYNPTRPQGARAFWDYQSEHGH
jgi:hypothetical protein